ncbi:MAG TPA: DUF1800 domain-containing protein, partial [Chitinophagales bacterium]|nr:DUF1800 domain-containing protein [Chitinophagales bacterium]
LYVTSQIPLMASQQRHVQHLYLRAGFGESPAIVKQRSAKEIKQLVDDLFTESKQYRNLTYLENPAKGKEVSNLKVLLLILKSQEQMRELNNVWMGMLASTKAVLREKMTLFWHDHFATSTQFAYLMQLQNNTLRKHALGRFDKLLHAIAKDPAMIIYLNNQQNKKDAPNENFAREVMELFTLGEGNKYTEADIKEAARAFTGWTVNKKGEFEFVAKDHDDESKTFLGRAGNFNGEDIINILLEEKQTAKYVTTKIYKEFVNDNVNDAHVEALSTIFFDSGYDISALMRNIFTADWFYADENMGSLIASPVDLITRFRRLIKMEFKEEKGQFNTQKILGQVLFFPPNVAGWKGGRNWVDSSTLMLRMQIPTRIIRGGGFNVRPKPEFEDAPEDEMTLKTSKKADVRSDWSGVVNYFKDVPTDQLTESVIETFIQSSSDHIDRNIIAQYVDNSSDEKRILSTIGVVMSLPEFQLI